MTKEELIKIAKQYREDHKIDFPYMLENGYVRIFDGKPYGWCAEMGVAKTERPNAFIVGIQGDVFKAIGGNDLDGAKEWHQI